MIRTFRTKTAEDVFHGNFASKAARRIPAAIQHVSSRKLQMVNLAADLNDLAVPTGNMLEALKGDLKGWHSIRVNQQYRILFRWVDRAAEDVDIVDYH